MTEPMPTVPTAKTRDVLEPYWNNLKDLRGMIDAANDKQLMRVVAHLMLLVLDKLTSISYNGRPPKAS